MAADAAARGIRSRDEEGEILLLTDEGDAPYDRPPLSKELLTGDVNEEGVLRATASVGVDVRTGVKVRRVDLDARQVVDDGGTRYPYRRLLLATGARPRRLTGPDDAVIYFRTLEDARTLLRHVKDGAAIGVVGGGFIGSEVSASLARRGCEVRQFFPEAAPMGLLLPNAFARLLATSLGKAGVDVNPGTEVLGVERSREGHRLLTDGGAVDTAFDVVVAGLGVTPAVGLAEQSGLEVEDGIVVDEHLCTSDPRVFAAGDVASFPVPWLGGRHRVEHEEHANESGLLAGQAMAGADVRYDPVPYVYSQVGPVTLEILGIPARGERWECASPEAPSGRGLAVCRDGEGAIVGVAVWNRPGRARRLKEALRESRNLGLDALAVAGGIEV
jgi:3-phenylpropionate/trans-cinnamate dioxygenase ferredoxin reductase component